MVRISPVVSHGIVEKKFLPRFCELCSESMFHIRKVCAANIGEMCRIVGSQLAEEHLLPKFFNLCEDGIWGVRKACTECFMTVSNALSPTTRRNDLAQLFVGLLCDQSRWVRMSAFQALGPFISTFADPDMTGLYFDEDGILRVSSLEKQKPLEKRSESPASQAVTVGCEKESPLPNSKDQSRPDDSAAPNGDGGKPADSVKQPADESQNSKAESSGDKLSPDMDLSDDIENFENRLVCNPEVSLEEVRCRHYTEETQLVPVEGEQDKSKIEQNQFATFNYWRAPVPTVDIQSLLEEVSQSGAPEQPANVSSSRVSETPPELETAADTTQLTVDQNLEALASSLHRDLTIERLHLPSDHSNEGVTTFMFGPSSSPLGSTTATYTSLWSTGSRRSRNMSAASSGSESGGVLTELMARQQDIIPHLLLENYLSMTDPSRAQTVDTDIAQHCAYSLPAVAFTLGKDNWKCLRTLYDTLVTDMQWKVRRTLAHSIHELAVILGPELTHSDLIPIFNNFIKDLDEVRIGVLTHLADFVKLLNEEARKSYLPKLVWFLQSDNNRIWRARLDLAQQLVQLCDLYDVSDVVEYIVPLTLQLLQDRVADVRSSALPLISRVLKSLRGSEESQRRLTLINDLIKYLALSSKWHARQTYVQACNRVLYDSSLELDQFSKELLPSILTLGADKIPNVRIAVAALLSQRLLPLEYFTSSRNPHHDELLKTESELKSDVDRDVRYYANLAPQTSADYHETVDV